MRWARRSTARYPGVRVNDFTASWRDGLAFSALVHRNRPDLLDWRKARSARPRERLETAFHVVEKEYGVTRLLDPEGTFYVSFFSLFIFLLLACISFISFQIATFFYYSLPLVKQKINKTAKRAKNDGKCNCIWQYMDEKKN